MTVQNGSISDITVTSYRDDRQFFSKAEQKIIPAIIEAQDTDVDTVSGATYSSYGIISAVADALEDQLLTNENTSNDTQSSNQIDAEAETAEDAGKGDDLIYQDEDADDDDNSDDENNTDTEENTGAYADGTYYGSGSGLRGTTNVEVNVENGVITGITVTSYQDDTPYFSRAQSRIIPSIIVEQSIDVSTVSGATYSSNSIIEAVADALGLDFTNPNSSMGGGGHHH